MTSKSIQSTGFMTSARPAMVVALVHDRVMCHDRAWALSIHTSLRTISSVESFSNMTSMVLKHLRQSMAWFGPHLFGIIWHWFFDHHSELWAKHGRLPCQVEVASIYFTGPLPSSQIKLVEIPIMFMMFDESYLLFFPSLGLLWQFISIYSSVVSGSVSPPLAAWLERRRRLFRSFRVARRAGWVQAGVCGGVTNGDLKK